ncbi:MAG: hypothetical protein A3E80_03135 [Chlamydiae bacterium RIFCSPHIGHO2_12_FULL_49_9]|nr:MAG: hypothetical protein A3E80_03135 [Chlamydiae bacterium RIFCSPHIGHO2_12_FULL_49_9]
MSIPSNAGRVVPSVVYNTFGELNRAVDFLPKQEMPLLGQQVKQALENPEKFIEEILRIQEIVRASKEAIWEKGCPRKDSERFRSWKTLFCVRLLRSECCAVKASQCHGAHSIKLIFATNRLIKPGYKQRKCENKDCKYPLCKGEASYSYVSYEKCDGLHEGDLYVNWEEKAVTRFSLMPVQARPLPIVARSVLATPPRRHIAHSVLATPPGPKHISEQVARFVLDSEDEGEGSKELKNRQNFTL